MKTRSQKIGLDRSPSGKGARALRRAALEKMKAKSRKIYPHDKKAKLANHLASCSCPACGNPRSIEGVTLSERKSMITLREEIIQMAEKP